VGVVSVPFKATSSDLNRVSYGYFGWFGWKGLRYPKRNIIKRREPRDVIAQVEKARCQVQQLRLASFEIGGTKLRKWTGGRRITMLSLSSITRVCSEDAELVDAG
jgi:hypothetical protein